MSKISGVTVVIAVRNREPARLSGLVDSLRAHGADPFFIVVDYGSNADMAQSYAASCVSLGIKYERMETDGLPWNKCQAINRGARITETEYIATSDIDILYTSDPFPFCFENSHGKSIFHLPTYWLPKNGNHEKARFAGTGNCGGFVFSSISAFEESGGYDEQMKYWGQEDRDWPSRLRALGYSQEWLPDAFRIYHRWHVGAEAGARRPLTAEHATMERCAENALKPVIDQAWGKPVEVSDRPILGFRASERPLIIDLEPNILSKFEGVQIVARSRARARFVRLELGPRLVKRPLSALSDAALAALRPAAALLGLSCAKKTNANFDFFYALLPALSRNGLIDYFISPNLRSVDLLWALRPHREGP